MTDPKQSDNGWNLQDLPVLTEVVAESAGELEVPAFDFSAELDELARSMPAPAEPELELPPELSLDDVLGDEPQPDDDAASLDASKLIERLPSLDLEVDEPGDLSLDDVLPGLAPVADVESSPVTDADFAFELPGEPQPGEVAPAAEAGLDALFARARFEPVLLEQAEAELIDDDAANPEAGLHALQAELEQFAEPTEMPELPADAFLQQGGEEAVMLIEAAEPDPVWSESWQPAPEPLASEEEPALPPVVSEVLAAESPLLEAMEDAASEQQLLADASVQAVMATELPAMADSPQPSDALHEALATEAALPPESSVDSGQFHVSLDDLLASLQPAAPAEIAGAAEVAEVTEAAAVAEVAEASELAAEPNGWPVAAEQQPAEQNEQDVSAEAAPAASASDQVDVSGDWPPQMVPPLVDVVTDLAEEMPIVSEVAEAVPEPAAEDGWPQEMLDDAVLAVDGEPEAEEPLESASALLPQEPPASPAAAPVLQSISIDSLPSGVLGGGLGAVDVSALAAAAQLGASAGSLPGGSDWPLRQPLRTASSARDVEMDWARDLHAEPPQGIALQDEPEAMVMRSRRLGPAEAVVHEEVAGGEAFVPPFTMAEEDAPLPPFTMAPAPEPEPQSVAAATIRVESVTPPLAAMAALGNVDEEALIEALYARVLPRMKVELTLWMQDAMEQQAKQLISGVMQQLKEDFDMMLAQSLKESLREALDEVAPAHNKDN